MAVLRQARCLVNDVRAEQRRTIPAAQADFADDRGLVGGGPRDDALRDLLSTRSFPNPALSSGFSPALPAGAERDDRHHLDLLPEEHGDAAGFRSENRCLLRDARDLHPGGQGDLRADATRPAQQPRASRAVLRSRATLSLLLELVARSGPGTGARQVLTTACQCSE